MPQTITPAGIELNPQTEPLKDLDPFIKTDQDLNITQTIGSNENDIYVSGTLNKDEK